MPVTIPRSRSWQRVRTVLREREDGEDRGEHRQRGEDAADVRAKLGGRGAEGGDESGGRGHAQRELVAQGGAGGGGRVSVFGSAR